MTDDELIANAKAVVARIDHALKDADRPVGTVDLTIVTKTWEAARIEPLLEAGYCRFGENRVQESQQKWPSLKAAYPAARLHLIGPLQSKKSADAVAIFDVIETLDREKLGHTLKEAMAARDRWPDLFVQVNTGEELQKSGIAPTEAVAFAAWAQHDLGLPVVGMMAIPPAEDAPAPHFALLRQLTDEAGLPKCSMGMSGDYEIAAMLGATHVRVGSAIFGPRQKPL